MKLILRPSSMIPIYEQISDQIRTQIKQGELKAFESLPSVRALARTYQISALTVKKAYDVLDREGLIKTIPGKGSYVCEIPASLVKEEVQKQAEALMSSALEKIRLLGLEDEQIREIFDLMIEQ